MACFAALLFRPNDSKEQERQLVIATSRLSCIYTQQRKSTPLPNDSYSVGLPHNTWSR